METRNQVAEAVFSPNVCDTHIWSLGIFHFRFTSTTQKIEELRIDIKSHHWIKVKLKLLMD